MPETNKHHWLCHMETVRIKLTQPSFRTLKKKKRHKANFVRGDTSDCDTYDLNFPSSTRSGLIVEKSVDKL